MIDLSFGIVKKSKVAALAMLQEIYYFPFHSLLRCIARNLPIANLETHLREP